MSPTYQVSGDEGVGSHRPPRVLPPDFRRLRSSLLKELARLQSATATASDILDELGLALAVPADLLEARYSNGAVAGQVLTVRYLPERRAFANVELRETPSRLAHHSVFSLCRQGDVVVIDAHGVGGISVFGGMAALAARSAGVAACVVDGAVRDLAEIRQMALPVWSRSITPKTGKWRLEAVSINDPVMCGGVQVHPGDLMIADESGICFFPIEAAEVAAARILEVGAAETSRFGATDASRR